MMFLVLSIVVVEYLSQKMVVYTRAKNGEKEMFSLVGCSIENAKCLGDVYMISSTKSMRSKNEQKAMERYYWFP